MVSRYLPRTVRNELVLFAVQGYSGNRALPVSSFLLPGYCAVSLAKVAACQHELLRCRDLPVGISYDGLRVDVSYDDIRVPVPYYGSFLCYDRVSGLISREGMQLGLGGRGSLNWMFLC